MPALDLIILIAGIVLSVLAFLAAGISYIIFRKKQLSNFSFASLILSFLSLALAGSACLADKLSSVSHWIYYLWSYIFWIIHLTAFGSACVALKEADKMAAARQRLSVRTAWSSLIILVLVWVALVFLATYYTKSALPPNLFQIAAPVTQDTVSPGSHTESEEEKFPEYNFSYKPHSPLWIKFGVSQLSVDAITGYIQVNPNFVFFIIAEKSDSNYHPAKLDIVADLVIGNAKAKMGNFQLLDRAPFEYGNYQGIKLKYSGDVQGKHFNYINWIIEYGGNLYQLSLFSLDREVSMQAMDEEFQKVIQGFKLLDESSVIKRIDGEYQSEKYFYRIAKREGGWRPQILPASVIQPDFNAFNGKSHRLTVLPFSLLGLSPSTEEFVEAALISIQINFKEAPLERVTPVKMDGYEGFSFYFTWHENNSTSQHKVLVLKGEKFGYLINAAVFENSSIPYEELDKLMESFTLLASEKPLAIKDMDDASQKRHAFLINELGVRFYQEKDYKQSLSYFDLAHTLSPEDFVIFANLVRSYAETGDKGKANQLIKNRRKSAPSGFQLEALEADVEYKTGNKDAAFKIFEKLYRENGDNQEFIRIYIDFLWELGKRDEAIDVLKKSYEKSPSAEIGSKLIAMYEANDNLDKAIEYAYLLQKQFMFNDNNLLYLLKLLNQKGSHEEVLTLANERIQRGPTSPEIYLFKGFAHSGLGQYKDAEKTFEDLKQKLPNDTTVDQYLQEIKTYLGTSSLNGVNSPIEPVALPPSFLKDSPADKDDLYRDSGAYYQRLWISLLYEKNHQYKKTIYRRIKILNEKKMQGLNELTFSFDSFREDIYVNSVNVYDENGKLLTSANPKDFYVVDDSDAGYASYDKILHVPVPGLKVGAILDYTVTYRQEEESLSIFPFESFFASRELPIHDFRIILAGNKDDVKVVAMNQVTRKEIGSDYIVWQVVSQPAYWSERSLPSMRYFLPAVFMGPANTSWQNLATDYLKTIGERLESTEEVKKIASEITAGLTTNDEKAEVLAQYIRKNYTYNAIEFGMRALIPNSAEAILKKRYGDCKDFSLIYYHLLKAVGIQAYLVLANTDEDVLQEIVSTDQFNHMITYCAGCETPRFIDTTERYPGSREVPFALGGKSVLVLDPENPRLMKISSYSLNPDRVEVVRDISLNEDDLIVNEKVTLQNYTAANWHFSMAQKDKKEWLNVMQDFISDYEEKLQVETLDFNDPQDPYVPLVFQIQYRVERWLERHSDGYFGVLPAPWEKAYLRYSHVRERQYPFEIEYPLHLTSDITMNMPKGYKLSSVSSDSASSVSHKDNMIEFDFHIRESNDKKFQLNLDTKIYSGVYPAGDYLSFQNASESAIQAISRKIVMRQD